MNSSGRRLVMCFQFFFFCSLETCCVESRCISKHQLGLKESYFYCHSRNLSIVLTPPCTFCLQHLTKSAEGKLSQLESYYSFFPGCANNEKKKKVPKYPV